MDILYGLENEEPDWKIIDVFVCHLRRKLKGLGIFIKPVRSEGYYLKMENGQ